MNGWADESLKGMGLVNLLWYPECEATHTQLHSVAGALPIQPRLGQVLHVPSKGLLVSLMLVLQELQSTLETLALSAHDVLNLASGTLSV